DPPDHRPWRGRERPGALPRARPRGAAGVNRLRAAITIVFFANGALFASWASRIPALADRTDATTAALGRALLAPPVGALVTMPQIGKLLTGRSSRTFCRWSLGGLMAAIVLPGF